VLRNKDLLDKLLMLLMLNLFRFSPQFLDCLGPACFFRVGYNKNEWEGLILVTDNPLDGSVQLVGVSLVEVEWRDSKVFPHQARHVHVVQGDGGHRGCCSQEFRNQGGGDQVSSAITIHSLGLLSGLLSVV